MVTHDLIVVWLNNRPTLWRWDDASERFCYLRNVTENAGILDAVLREVDRIRAEQGLPPNDEALKEAAG